MIRLKAQKRKRLKLKIVERKLRREKALGQCYKNTGLIEIDPRARSRSYLNTLCHEMLHCIFPELSESNITRTAGTMTRKIWEAGYRRLRK